MSANPPPGGSDGPVKAWRFSLLRDRVLTAAAGLLSRTVSPLWYAETLVLSARYQQFLASAPWAADRIRCSDRVALWQQAAAPRLKSATFTALEFGVADGMATQWWADSGIRFSSWHGFDTFDGLPADWLRGGVPVMSAGVFRPSGGAGVVPQIQASFPYEWHRGLIQDTLPAFPRPDTALFILIDVDLMEPTAVVLDWLRAHGRPGDVIYFDEAFDPWNEGLAIRQALSAGLAVKALAYTGSALLLELV